MTHIVRILIANGRLTALVCLPLLAAGCGKGPTLGSTLSAQGAEIAVIGDRWTEGDELAAEGEDQIERGRDLIERGEALVSQGEENVAQGNALMEAAEDEYRASTGRDLPLLN